MAHEMHISDCSSDVCSSDLRNAASKLGETLLQLFTVIVRRSRLDLRADLLDPALDALGVARTIDKGRVVLVDRDALGAAKHVERDGFQLAAEIFGADRKRVV